MIKIALRDVWAHAARFVLTIVSVILGVAFLSGTLALRSSLEDTFVSSFAATTVGTIQVEGQPLTDESSSRAQIDASVADTIRSVDGVEDAAPVYIEPITILQDGSPATGVGATTIAASTMPGFTPWQVTGSEPQGAGEVAFEAAALERYGFKVGDEIEYFANDQKVSARIVGVVHLAAEVSPMNIVEFDPETVRSFKDDPNKVRTVSVETAPGADVAAVMDQIRDAVGPDFSVVSTAEKIDETAETVKDTLGFVTTFLLVFVVLALGTSTFIITNTFRMAVKARQKEFAYLRAVGASPFQIFMQVALQALIIGVVGSLLGLAAGTGLMALASYALAKVGMTSTVTAVLPRSVWIISLALGTAVTVIGAILPARAAAQTPPVEAMREVSGVREPSLKPRTIIGLLLILAGAAGVFAGATNAVDWPGKALGLGAGSLIVGLLVASPSLAVAVIGTLAFPIRKMRSAAARIGAGNATRNPRRTAATAGALIIGMGLVTLGTVLSSSVQASTKQALESELKADFIIASITPGGSIPDDVVTNIRDAAGVASVNDSYQMAFGSVLDEDTAMPMGFTVTDAENVTKDFDMQLVDGGAATLSDGQALLPKQLAEAMELEAGDELTVVGNTGPYPLTVGGIHDSTLVSTTALITPATLDQLGLNASGRMFVTVVKDASTPLDTAQANIRGAISDYPTIAVYSKADMVSTVGSAISTVLAILYALLGLSIVVAIVGIVNTLGLAVSERSGEIALMRAIGTSKIQISATIMVEAILTSLYGTLIGIGAGLGVGVGLVRYLKDSGISTLAIPWPTLGIMIAGTIVVGALAAIGPARRAAKQPILEVIAAE